MYRAVFKAILFKENLTWTIEKRRCIHNSVNKKRKEQKFFPLCL
jgi:hypothetical protein